jgi:hypothetical protein
VDRDQQDDPIVAWTVPPLPLLLVLTQINCTSSHKVCALSHEPLGDSVVMCKHGWLMNLEAASNFVHKDGQFASARAHFLNDKFSHLQSLRDLKLLKLDLVNAQDSSAPATAKDPIRPHFKCPITGRLANGAHKFVGLWRCGHVFSQKAVEV